MPAFQEFKEEVENHGYTATVHKSAAHAQITVTKGGKQILNYELRSQISSAGAYVFPYTNHIDKTGNFGSHGSFQNGDITVISKEELLKRLTASMKDDVFYATRP